MKNPTPLRPTVITLAALLCAPALWFAFKADDSHRADSTTTAGSTKVGRPLSSPSTPGETSAVSDLDDPAAENATTSSDIYPAPDMAKIEAFVEWAKNWQESDPDERAALTEEGVRLATERRPEFKSLIVNNPRRALELSVPRVIRQDLPAEIVALLEKPVSAKGDLNVYFGTPAPGTEVPLENLTLRYFETEGNSYRARVFGELSQLTSRQGMPLRGVALDGEFAVAENAVRRLEVGERIPAGVKVEDTCPVSGKTTVAVSTGEVVTDDKPTVEIVERVITLCDGSHVTVLEENFRTYIQASGSGGGGFFVETFPGASTNKAVGNLRCLYIRTTYPDQMAQPNTEDQAYADMRDNARFYLENSYGKLTQTTTFTPLITLPRSLAWYKAMDSATGGTVDCLGLIHTEASNVAKELGYDTSLYNSVIVCIRKGPRLEGISWGGGNRVWVTWNGMGVLNHEIGHSLARNHANFWTSSDGVPHGVGANQEYGNSFDSMGNAGNNFALHYNAISKRALDWLPADGVHNAKLPGVYRIFAYDQPTLEMGKRYALNVVKDSVRQYNIEYHPAVGGFLANSALVLSTGYGSNCGHLFDVTQGTLDAKNDAGISIGRTYSDLEADMHFTVLSKNATTPPSLDVSYQRGPFPGNVAPTATISASATTVAVGGAITFTATASDANGDPLAYHWEFSDRKFGDVNAASCTRTFTAANRVTAMVTVSDMKGGTVRQSVVVNVGSHTKQTIAGSVTVGGQPLSDVLVAEGSVYAYTDASGNYSLAGVSTGARTLTAFLAGHTFTAGFTNPLTVVSGTNTANWTATAPNSVTLSKVSDATEGGASGTFRLTRTGDTAAALTVLVSPVSGTAVKTTDYTFSPDYTASGSYFAFTIAAGSATRDITVAAVNDIAAEGPETVSLQLSSGAGYLSRTGNAVVMSLNDNDTSLPQVSLAATDTYASEDAGDPGQFTFSRTGSTAASLNLAVTWTGTATNGSDYNTLPATVTIPVGEDSVAVNIAPINDSAIETLENVIATISTNAAYVIAGAGANTASVALADNDTAVVSVSVPDSSAAEGGTNPGLFRVTRTGSTAASLKVYYGLSGSAMHGTDYQSLSGDVTIPAGSTSADIAIIPQEDDFAEPAEVVTLAVTTFNNEYSIGQAFQGAVTITDNGDVPLLNVRSGVVGTEGGTNPTFIIRSYGNGSGTITVNYTISGTATSGVDYTALSGSVSVNASGAQETTVTVPLVNDTLAEATETIVVKLTPSSAYRVYNDDDAVLFIHDNDSGERVSVSNFNQTPAESGSAIGTFHFYRLGTTGALTVNYTVSGSATNGTDYNTLSGTATILDGQTGVNVVLTPINDTIAEGFETVTVTVAAGPGYGPGWPTSATYAITDNETPAISVGFASTSSTTSEQAGSNGQFRDFTVNLSASSASTVSVGYKAGGGTAIGDDVDWTFVDAYNGNAVVPVGTLTFAPGVTSRIVRIRIKNDGYLESAETAVLLLHTPVGLALPSANASHTVTMTDIPPNSTPAFASNPINLNATEDVAFSGQLVANDVDTGWGDSLTFTKVSGPSWLTVSATGALSGNPTNAQVGLHVFTVQVSDESNTTDTATLNLTVLNINDAPAFAADPVNLNATEDIAFTGQLSASDVDAGDSLTFTKVSGPAWLTISATGAISGTPTNSEVGLNVFSIKVTDESNTSDTATLNLTVLNVNDAPAFTASTYGASATEDVAYAGQLPASDVDAGDTIIFSKVSGPAWLTVSATGVISGTPTNANVGLNVFSFTVTDESNASDTATVNLTVANVNDAPYFTANTFNLNASEDAAFSGQLTANDVDAGDTLTYAKVSGPSWLTVSAATGALGGTPLNADIGLNTFTVSVKDTANVTVTATVNITVANVNDAPVFAANPISRIYATVGTTYTGQTLAGSASDEDAGDTIAYSKVSGPAWLTVTSAGALGGTPGVGDVGANAFTVKATDASGANNTATLNLTVNLLPLPWQALKVGTANLAGSIVHNNGAFSVTGSGLWGNPADTGYFLYQSLTGDGQITTRITTLQNTGGSARVGLMIRNSLADNSARVYMGMENSADYRWGFRLTDGGNTSGYKSGTGTVPNTWIRITRTGNSFVMAKSADGVTWTNAGSTTATFAANCYLGIWISSGSNTTTNTSVFNSVGVTP